MQAGEVVQWVSTLAALPEEPGSIPSTHTVGSQLSVTEVPEYLKPSDLHGDCMHIVYLYTTIHINIKNKTVGLHIKFYTFGNLSSNMFMYLSTLKPKKCTTELKNNQLFILFHHCCPSPVFSPSSFPYIELFLLSFLHVIHEHAHLPAYIIMGQIPHMLKSKWFISFQDYAGS